MKKMTSKDLSNWYTCLSTHLKDNEKVTAKAKLSLHSVLFISNKWHYHALSYSVKISGIIFHFPLNLTIHSLLTHIQNMTTIIY